MPSENGAAIKGYTIRMPVKLLDSLRTEAEQTRRSVNQHIVWVLESRGQIPAHKEVIKAAKAAAASY